MVLPRGPDRRPDPRRTRHARVRCRDAALRGRDCAIATALLFGLAPAWRVSRRDLTRDDESRRGRRGRVRHARPRRAQRADRRRDGARARAADGGRADAEERRAAAGDRARFRPDSVLTVRLALPAPKYNPQRGGQFFEQLLARLDGAARARRRSAFGSCPPLSGRMQWHDGHVSGSSARRRAAAIRRSA